MYQASRSRHLDSRCRGRSLGAIRAHLRGWRGGREWCRSRAEPGESTGGSGVTGVIGPGVGGVSVNRRCSHLSNWCLQLTLMLLKVKDTSVMLREGGTPGGSNLGSSSVMVAPRPTGPRSLTVMPIGSSQQLPCCETEVILHDPRLLKMVPGPTPRDLSGTIDASLASPR